jgi:ABC-2 type transport system ATP-binding protein
MKQKLGIVSAFQHQPDLLILDEPTTGLDPLVREVVFQLLTEAKAAGATVFHSSHVLSEVDRTCDRVGVLRNGHLSGVFTVDEARRTTARFMVVEFAHEPPVEEMETAGGQIDEVLGNRVRLSIAGGINPILRVLAGHDVAHMSFPEPSLEEAFKTFYGDPPPGEEGESHG